MKIMFHMEKATLIEKVELRKKLIKFGAVCGGILILLIILIIQFAELARLKGVNKDYTILTNEVKALDASIESQKKVMESYNIKLTKSELTKEEIIEYIGSSAAQSGCSISVLTGGTMIADKSVSRVNFKLEVTGDLTNIYKLLLKIEDLDAKYVLNSLSVRKSGDYLWLKRDTTTQSMLDWWDTSNLEQPQESAEKAELLTIDKIYEATQMLYFMDIDFIMPNI